MPYLVYVVWPKFSGTTETLAVTAESVKGARTLAKQILSRDYTPGWRIRSITLDS